MTTDSNPGGDTGSAPTGSTPGAPAYDLDRVRADFPILAEQARGRPISYLDNAASAQKPRAVLDAVARMYETGYANIHRGVHVLSERATRQYEAARLRLATFLGAASAEEVIFVRGATEGLNLVASCLGRHALGPGDQVLLTEMEHHSNIVPWQMVAETTGASVSAVRVTDRGELDLDDFAARLGDRTRIVSLVHVSNTLGTVNPVRRLAALARERGAFVVVDGAQAAPHLEIAVADLGCDFYAVSGHKMYGPSGIGVLWGRKELLQRLPPYQGGGEMIRSVRFSGTTYADPPAKFEAGTPNIAGPVGLAAAADYLDELGLEAVAAHEERLRRHAEARLAEIPGLRVIGTAPGKAAVVSFTVEGIHPHDLGTVLDQEGVCVRTGHHCTQPLMERYGVPATARASFGLYNTEAEVERLAAGLQTAIELFRP